MDTKQANRPNEMGIDFANTFDTTNALSAMYLWLLFGYLSVLLNCDLQRLIRSHPLVLHLVGIVAFFFLFTVLDANNKVDIRTIWLKTLVIYAVFVMITKSKWYFVVPVLALLLLDQSLKKDVAFRKASDPSDKIAVEEQKIQNMSSYINYVIYLLIFTGVIHYAYLQKLEYGAAFSWFEFFFGLSENCKKEMPSYTILAKR